MHHPLSNILPVELKSIITLSLAFLIAPALLPAQAPVSPTPSLSSTSAIQPSFSPAPAATSGSLGEVGSLPPVITAHNTTVVSADKLIELLPGAPPGWNADKPEGSTSNSTGFPLTKVDCVYVEGQADNAPTAAINIVDSAANQQFQDATKAMWSATGTTAAGYDKTVTVNGLPGFEHYTNADQTGALWVIAGGRFFVQIETTHLPPAELEAWLSRIDLQKLSTLR